MNTGRCIGLFLLFFFLISMSGGTGLIGDGNIATAAGEDSLRSLDKGACARLIRAGQEFYERGKYKEAIEYFRWAIQADPASARAWHFYDVSLVSAWASELKERPAPPPEAVTSAPPGSRVATSPASPAPSSSNDEGC